MTAANQSNDAVQIDSLDLEGRGVGRREGKVVFVEGALPSERVLVEIVKRKASYESGRVAALLNESTQRVTPGCPHFGLERGSCGGCSMQHLDPAAQVAIKQRVLEDALWHIGRIKPQMVLRPIAGPAWHYRHRARLSVRYVAKKGGALVGFRERDSSYVADMQQCHVLPVNISALLLPLRELIAGLSINDRLPQIEVAIDVFDRTVFVLRVLVPPTEQDRDRLRAFGRQHGIAMWLQPKGPDTAAPMDAADDAHDLALDLPEFGVRIPFLPTDFTQVNHRMNEMLVRKALRLLDPQPHERVLDLFCGLGNFTLPIATRARQVVGIEGSAALIERASAAAEQNGLAARTQFHVRNLFEWSRDDWEQLNAEAVDCVLIDPPRDGAHAVAQALSATQRRPRRVVYVSCSPASLARDSAVLVHEGGWQLKAAGVANMFPHTSHVESIAVFEPRN